ncbi:hypothetical protein BDV12DRAFT_175632 [Aspergillus spectabilis]
MVAFGRGLSGRFYSFATIASTCGWSVGSDSSRISPRNQSNLTSRVFTCASFCQEKKALRKRTVASVSESVAREYSGHA